MSWIITKKKRHIKCFIATTDDEREICCWSVVVAVAAEPGCWLWLPVVSGWDHLHIMDMDPV